MLVNREELAADIARLKPALRSTSQIAALRHLWLTPEGYYAFDGGFGIHLPRENIEVNCGVPGSTFMALLDTSPVKELKLEKKNSALNISFGKTTSKLASLDADGRVWPFPEDVGKVKPLELGEEFIEALRRTLFVKARPATRVEHHGVMMVRNKKNVELYATDTNTMVRAVVEGAGGVAFESVLLPRDFAEQIVSQCPSGVALYILDGCLVAMSDDVRLYSNLLDTSSADDMAGIVSRLSEDHEEPVPLPAGLAGALERALILAGSELPAVSAKIEKNGLVLSAEYQLGTLSETLKLEGKLPAAELRFNAEHVKRALPFSESFSLNDKTLMLTGEPGFTYLVSSL